MLYLKRLELQGFKSFADYTELEFGPGITVIVGPNGGGKSNLAEAVRWVLGEQNPRALRGTRLEDVIFSGTSKRRPLGMAEVTLTLDNSQKLLPVDCAEVSLTRRLYRSGESEYFINRKPCRLRDVHELLAGRGLGRTAFFIVGQGKIEEFVSMSPEERMAFLEEVAGTALYRRSKRAALARLEQVAQDLRRLEDLLGELEDRRALLASQARAAAEYRALRDELRELELLLWESQLARMEEEEERLRVERRELAARRGVLEVMRESLERVLPALRTGLEAWREEVRALEEELAACEDSSREKRLLQARLEEKLKALGPRLDSLKARREALQEEVQAAEENLRMLEEEAARLAEELRVVAEVLLEQEALLGEERVKKEIAAREQRAKAAALARALRERDELAGRLRELGVRREFLAARARELREKLAATREKEGMLAGKLRLLEQLRQDGGKYLQELARAREELERKWHSLRARLGELREGEHLGRGYPRGVRELLAALERGELPREGIFGVVGEMLSTDPEYALALEVALGRAVFYVVCSGPEVAREAISFLKKKGEGRVTFVPLSILREEERAAPRAALPPGILGRAADLVRCEPRFRKVASFLLGSTFFATDFASAQRFAAQHSYRLRLVTLDGDLIQPGGLITGGRIRARWSSRSVAGERQELEEALAGLERERKHLEEDFLRAREEQYLREQELARLAAQLEELRDFRKGLEEDLAAVLRDEERAGEEWRRLAAALEAARHRVAALEEERRAFEEVAAGHEEGAAGLLEEHASLRAVLAGRGEELRARGREREAAAVHRYRLGAELMACREQERELREEAAILASQERALGTEVAALEAQCLRLAAARARKRKLLGHEEALCSLRAERLARVRRRLEEAEGKLEGARAQLERLAALRAEVVAHLRREYGVEPGRGSPGKVLGPREERRIRARIAALKQQLEALGEVNLAAPREHAALEERCRTLRAQKNDLEAGREQLLAAIRDLDARARAQLLATYGAVREKFCEVFADLTGGGRAELVLTGAEDCLTAGLEVVVKPRGKRPRHLSLLSGGERALAGIAFVFALLLTRPGSFYFFDEIEAALDEANLARFVRYLKELGKTTQIILITHRYRTMEAADVLYGVTMEEPGVSKLVSVRFTGNNWEKAG